MSGIKILDDTLRDGMHAWGHKLRPERMAEVAAALDRTGVDSIEFGHGNGMGGSSFQYGFAAASDEEYLKAVSSKVKNARMAFITIPGIGTRETFKLARDYGVSIARVATQITENDIAEQHIRMAKEMGFEARAVLPAARPISVADTVLCARKSEKYGADVVYLLDGSGTMVPEEVYDRVIAMKKALAVEVGFHGHNNLQLAVANTLAAIEGGATHVDCCLRGFGAGAGNCPTEILVALCSRLGHRTGVDLYNIMDVAEKDLEPLMPAPMKFSNDAIMLGYAGTYSSFLLFARRAGQRYQVDPRRIIEEMGRRQCTEGQENLCIEVAYDLSHGSGKGNDS
jgi:4-hydroxy-2-oxovalerate/4-hydroxy-2-oxohexanoate aldolase